MVRSVRLAALGAGPLLLVALAVGCGRESGSAPLVYYESYDPRSLDPAFSTDVPTGEMVTLLYDCLTRFSPDGGVAPGLSDRWTTSADGRRYVFHLRPNVRFHDGSVVTARHIRSSLLRVLDPQARGGRAWPLLPIAGASAFASGAASDVAGIAVVGDTAVSFTLDRPLAVFPKFLAMPVASITPDPAPANLSEQPVGTGPWRFVSWRHDDQLVFARYADYWGGAAQADTLVVRIIPEELTRAAEFEAGRLSIVEIPFGETARWERDHPAWLQRKPALRATYVALNTTRGPLRDARVRQAINHAVNVDAILTTIFAGRGVIARGAIPPSLPGGDTTRPRYGFDPDRARQLLTAAGYPQGIDLQLWRSASNVVLGQVAQAIQADLAKVGIRVELVTRDASAQRDAARKGLADMAILDWWADYPDGENFLFPLFHSSNFGPGGNYAFYADKGVDSLIERARGTIDDAQRAALYQELDDRVYRAAPWLYLWFPVDLWAQHPSITGWELPVIFNGQRWTGVRRQP
jgi:peptide/nickel transport system substrate-binding protein/oligopeptide transport system substrate-binding protein